MASPQTLGTLLRILSANVDAAVEQLYSKSGLDYKARYTPVVRLLIAEGSLSLRALSRNIGISHSAVSQTVSQMARAGLVDSSPGIDARERVVTLTPAAMAIVPQLQRQWRATDLAVEDLERELGLSLLDALRRAISALEDRPFVDRVTAALSAHTKKEIDG